MRASREIKRDYKIERSAEIGGRTERFVEMTRLKRRSFEPDLPGRMTSPNEVELFPAYGRRMQFG